jgi:hypothetical protein
LVAGEKYLQNIPPLNFAPGGYDAFFVVNPYIELLDMVELQDDREVFVNYYVCPVASAAFLERVPEASAALLGLA